MEVATDTRTSLVIDSERLHVAGCLGPGAEQQVHGADVMFERGPELRVFRVPTVVSELYPNSRGRKHRLVEVPTRVRPGEVIAGARPTAQLDEALVLARGGAVVGRPCDGSGDAKQAAQRRDEPVVH